MSDTENIYSIASIEDKEKNSDTTEESEFIDDITRQIENMTPYLSELVEIECTHNWEHMKGSDSNPCYNCERYSL